MHQTLRRVVAPLNTNPKWPEGYIAVLREAGAGFPAAPGNGPAGGIFHTKPGAERCLWSSCLDR